MINIHPELNRNPTTHLGRTDIASVGLRCQILEFFTDIQGRRIGVVYVGNIEKVEEPRLEKSWLNRDISGCPYFNWLSFSSELLFLSLPRPHRCKLGALLWLWAGLGMAHHNIIRPLSVDDVRTECYGFGRQWLDTWRVQGIDCFQVNLSVIISKCSHSRRTSAASWPVLKHLLYRIIKQCHSISRTCVLEVILLLNLWFNCALGAMELICIT